jgi:hypothetical protein
MVAAVTIGRMSKTFTDPEIGKYFCMQSRPPARIDADTALV